MGPDRTRRAFLKSSAAAGLITSLEGLVGGCATTGMRETGLVHFPALKGKKIQPPPQGCLVGYYASKLGEASRSEFLGMYGRNPALVVFQDWPFTHPFPTDTRMPLADVGLRMVAQEGVIPFVMSSPYGMHSKHSLAEILSGAEGRLIQRFAEGARQFGEENGGFFFAPMWGMNYERRKIWPWAGEPELFKQIWRHVWNIFEGEGANEYATWVPEYLVAAHRADLSGYYPGDEYVDWIGLSAYNRSRDGGPRSLDQLLGETVDYFRRNHPTKPLMLAEVGCTRSGPGQRWNTQAHWLRDALETVRQTPAVKAFTYWSSENVELRDDHSLDEASRRVLREALQDPHFLLAQPPMR